MVYADDNLSTAEVLFDGASQAGEYILSGQSIAEKGVYEFRNMEVIMKPDSQTFVVVKINNVASYGNDISFITTPIKILLKARACIDGERYTNEMKC
jgi:hypothetical protein